jgi:non-specific serine/threonine protein kinase
MRNSNQNRRTAPSAQNLPIQLTSFVGREKEIAEINELLVSTSLLTLCGTGGVGKTRLSLESAGVGREKFRDGIWLVELDSLSESHLIVDQVFSALGVRGDKRRLSPEDLSDYLCDKELLLILDNCEHLIFDIANLVQKILLTCSTVKILATSREPLGCPGEFVYQVPVMELPKVEQEANLEILEKNDSVKLLIERIRTYHSDFQLDLSIAPAAIQICHRLEGLPLAIELAAARAKLLSLPQIASRLEDSLQLLTKGTRTGQPRHQTLRATIEWSHSLLSDKEQILFRRLSVFSGRFTLDDVESVCQGRTVEPADGADFLSADQSMNNNEIQPEEVIDLFSNLVDKSLLKVVMDQDAIYRMLIPIRQFSREKLVDSGEYDYFHQRHLDYYLNLANEGKSKLRSPEGPVWSERLENEHDNLRAALSWSLENGLSKQGLQLACNLRDFWFRHGYHKEGVEWFEKMLASAPANSTEYSRALVIGGVLNYEYGNFDRAKSYAEHSLQLSEDFEDQGGIARAKCLLGIIAHFSGNRQEGIRLLEDSVALFRELDDDWNAARTLLYLIDAKARTGKLQEATALSQECLSLFQQLGDQWGISFAMGCCGELARRKGEFRQALNYFHEALALQTELVSLVDVCFILEATAILKIEIGDTESGVKLWGSTVSLREILYAPMPPTYEGDYFPYISEARNSLGDDVFQEVFEIGKAQNLEEIISTAMDFDFSAIKVERKTRKIQEQKFGLTEREMEVLRLVVEGCTDSQVAEQLYISPRTVGKHLQSIYRKLQVTSRTAAARFATVNDII